MALFLRQADLHADFSCPICSQLPHEQRVEIVDAITLGFPRKLFLGLAGDSQSAERERAWITSDLDVGIPNAHIRRPLRRLSESMGALSVDELAAVIQRARAGGHHFVISLLEHFQEEEVMVLRDGFYRIPCPVARAFLRGITQEQPASGFWDPAGVLQGPTWKDLRLTLVPDADLSTEDLAALRISFPPLYSYLIRLPSNNKPDPTPVRAPLKLCSFLDTYFVRSAVALTHSEHNPTPLQAPPFEDPYKLTFIGPNHPLQRLVRTYEVDGYERLGSRTHKKQGAADKEGTQRCTKFELSHSSLTPGVIHMSCPHKMTHIASIMERKEGPTMPFEIFFSRFLNAPKVIVYDNACNLHVTCQRREPSFFSKTLFFCDRLHFKGHGNCSTGYSLNSLPSQLTLLPNLTVQDLNTQVSEQLNRKFQAVRTQMAYMSHRNFLRYLTVFLVLHNRLQKKRLI